MTDDEPDLDGDGRLPRAETMRGCFTVESKAADAPSVDPEQLTADWLSDLPSE